MAVGEFDAAFSSYISLSLAEDVCDRQGLLVCLFVLRLSEVSMVRDELVDGHGFWKRRWR